MEPLAVVVVNARSVRQRPSKKTDKADAAWLAEFLAHDLVELSILPPPAVQALRDLTRTRVALCTRAPKYTIASARRERIPTAIKSITA